MKRFYYINLILMGFYCNGYAFNDTTIKGNCNIVVTGEVKGNITCQNIPEKALETLNKLLSSPDKINEMFDSARTIQNLNDLVSLKEEKLHKTELTLQEKIIIANDWAKKYQELEQRLKDETDELSKQALMALQNGDLIKAGELLDKSIDKREQQVDKLAKDHFTRAKVFQLQFEPVKALPHFKKAYTYRPDNLEYSFKYARALQKQNDFKAAAPIYETYLEKARESDDQEQVANTLNNLGTLYSDTQRLKEAEHTYQEALDIRRTLAKTNPQTYLPDVAITLNNLGLLYSYTQRLKEAEHTYQEALEIRRNLAKTNPQTYLPSVAIALNNLGILYKNTQRLKEAEQTLQEALEIRRTLAKTNPQTYLPDVAMTLNNLGVLYKYTQRLKEAEQTLQEALDIRRTLAKTNPQTYLPDVAMTLNNLGILYKNTQRLKEAEHTYQEALEIYRNLAKTNPQTHLPSVATTLNNLGILYQDTQRLKEAEHSHQEALDIRRTLAKTNPQTHLPSVAQTLNNLGRFYLQIDNIEKAESSLKESLEIRRKLFEKNPAAHGDDLARILALTALLKKDSPEFCDLLKEAFQVAHLKPLKEAIIRDGKTCNLTP
jgi:tetratricopeptide (TPR) repeat protein